MLVLLFLTGPLAYMPDAVLSAVVFLIGIDLIDIEGMKSMYAHRRSEFWVALITAVGDQATFDAVLRRAIQRDSVVLHPFHSVRRPASRMLTLNRARIK